MEAGLACGGHLEETAARLMRALAALVVMPILLAASPSTAPELVVDCYVVQSSSMGLGQFVRHLRVQPSRGVVSVSDGLRGGAPRFLGDGRLVILDANRLVFDFASATSSGRTEIDRRSGAFVYRDGRNVIQGSCREGGA